MASHWTTSRRVGSLFRPCAGRNKPVVMLHMSPRPRSFVTSGNAMPTEPALDIRCAAQTQAVSTRPRSRWGDLQLADALHPKLLLSIRPSGMEAWGPQVGQPPATSAPPATTPTSSSPSRPQQLGVKELRAMIRGAGTMQELHGIFVGHQKSLTADHVRGMMQQLRSISAALAAAPPTASVPATMPADPANASAPTHAGVPDAAGPPYEGSTHGETPSLPVTEKALVSMLKHLLMHRQMNGDPPAVQRSKSAQPMVVLNSNAGLRPKESSRAMPDAAAAQDQGSGHQVIAKGAVQQLSQEQAAGKAGKPARATAAPRARRPGMDVAEPPVYVYVTRLHNWAKAGNRPCPDSLSEVFLGCQQQMGKLDAMQVSSLFWSLAKLRARPDVEWARELCAHAAKKAATFGPREFCTVLWGLATLQLNPGQSWLSGWLDAILPCIYDFSPRDLTQTLWALAKLRHPPGIAWARAAANHAAASARRLSARDLSNLLWACARLSLNPGPEWLGAMLTPLAASDVALERLSLRDTSEILWALGRLGHRVPPRLVHILVWRFTRSRPPPIPVSPPLKRPSQGSLCVQDVANVCWSLAAMRFQPSPELRELLFRQATWVIESAATVGIHRKGPDGSLGDTAKVEGGLISDTPDAVSLSVGASQGHSSVQAKRVGRKSTRGQDQVSKALPVTLWSLTRLGWVAPNTMLLTTAARGASMAADDLTPQGATLLMYCFARAGHRPRPELLSQLVRKLQTVRTGPGPAGAEAPPPSYSSGEGVRMQTVSMMLWSLGKLQFRPPPGWIQRLLDATRSLMPHAQSVELCNLAKGLALLGHHPELTWAAEFSDCLLRRLVVRGAAAGAHAGLGVKQLQDVMWALPLVGMGSDGAARRQLSSVGDGHLQEASFSGLDGDEVQEGHAAAVQGGGAGGGSLACSPQLTRLWEELDWAAAQAPGVKD